MNHGIFITTIILITISIQYLTDVTYYPSLCSLTLLSHPKPNNLIP